MKKLVIFILFLFSLNLSASMTNNSPFFHITDKFGHKIEFYMPEASSDLEGFTAIQNDKNSKKIIWIAPFLAQQPDLAFAFFNEIKDRGNYLILSIKIQPSYNQTGIPYVDDYFIYTAFKLDNGIYKLDEELSNFLGAGGDIYDIQDINNADIIEPRITYIYPYKTEQEVRNALNSNLFKLWNSNRNKIIRGEIRRKTLFQDVSNYIQTEKKYLIKGDKFIIKNISSKWLEIEYKKRDEIIIGWVQCIDTNICLN
ncbi:hypothetical protein EDC44_1502 [Cricetibacter osteomyelitidis]|uniref:SH3 domain-containing protein n=1 Tax=Cricetibacter osteomyelitidis TaxID=1521931 RepID=A0A4R2T155_9PAST|nr:hypothetical protein [Cricetibacter osteomyelitidis]TCP88662.1 hypothetical protein EDC44_1502 [Cricetibacter osteomyelitidis]